MATTNQRLATLEAFMTQQKKTNLLFSESIASLEEKLSSSSSTTIPTVPVPSTGYLSLPLSAAKTITGQTNVVIENQRFENAADVTLYLNNCSDVIIRNCFFNKSVAEAVVLQGCKNVLVEKCLSAYNTCGVYAASSSGVRVINNQFVNMRQRVNADGKKARGQFVQFNTVTGGEVSGNKGENFWGESDPEDMISMFMSSGTPTNPILVRNNWGRGGGPSTSGGGILAGDHGGNYIIIENNQLVNPGNYGIAVVGGHYNTLNGNRVYSDFHTFNNAGVIIWAQGVDPNGVPITGSNVTYTNNHINFPYKNGGQNNLYDAGNCGAVKDIGNVYNESLAVMMPDFPQHLIDFITPEELLKIRGK